MSAEHPSPLRYPGGKSFLAGFLGEAIRLNGVEGGTYVEPFAGGAGAALKLLFGEHVGFIHLNDMDAGVFSFWKSILDDTDDFLKLLREIPINVQTWRKQKEVLRNPKGKGRLELGFALFFLNRTNRSGVLNGGPIGGFDQSGNYAIDVRFNRRELQKKIEKIALYRERITVSRKDAVELLEQGVAGNRWPERETIVYLDPPYYEQGKRLYSKFFRDLDHTRLARFLNGCNAFRWIVSYDDASLIHSLYAGEKNVLFMNYFMHTVRVGRELVIASADCELPTEHFEECEADMVPVLQARG